MAPGAEWPSAIKETIPSLSRRYDGVHAGNPKTRTIPVGLLDVRMGDEDASRPFGPVPHGWVEHVHVVEGLPFFYHSKLRVITDAYIRIPSILAQVEHWRVQLSRVLEAVDSTENQLSTMDIYIDPTKDSRTGQKTCGYYLIDHKRCTIAFLREVNTSAVSLPEVRSNIHLERVLRSEYWTHCEYMPRPDVDNFEHAKNLQGQLAALMIDSISSEGSTSPFTSEECKKYIQATNKNNEPQSLNWTVARVNSLLIQSQIINLHGEQWARADRTMIVTGQHASVRSASYLQRSKLMLGCPITYLNMLEHAWTDRVIYSHHWKKLISQLVEEWMVAVGVTGLVWIANMVLFSSASSPVTLLLLGISTGSAVFGAAKGLLLIRSHRALGQYAVHGSQFLQANEKYGTGLQGLSIEYSYPWACALWSGGATSAAVIWLIVSELVYCILGLFSFMGSMPFQTMFTGLLMVGAWVYGRGTEINLWRLLELSPTARPPYVIRTR